MFERESKEKLLDKMTSWSRAVSPKLSDFRRGSVIRTIYEAVALVVEGLYNRVFMSTKSLIETNLYAVIGFDKSQAKASSGKVVFGRSTPAPTDITIPAGTELVAEPTIYRPPITFYTVDDVVLRAGYTEVEGLVECVETGSITSIEANMLVTFVSQPFGIDTVTNPEAFVNGTDEETSEEQKVRFQEYMEANSRGSLTSIEYGSKKAFVEDAEGTIIERVIQAKALEDLENKLGQVDLYVWNGIGNPSEELKADIQKHLRGYTDADGNRVYGYKIAGTRVNIYPANVRNAKIKLALVAEEWAVEADVRATVEKELGTFFYRLRLGQTVLYADLLALIQRIDGVYDVRLLLSVDNGVTYDTSNITVDETTIVIQNDITYGV